MIKEYAIKTDFDRIGYELIPNDTIRDLFELIDKKEIIQLAKKAGSHNAVEYIKILYNDVNRDTLLQFLNTWTDKFAGHEHKIHGFTHWFLIRHDINEMYSLFLSELVKSLIDCTLKEPVKTLISERTVTFQFAL